MKLTQLTAKPQLIQISIDDEETVAEYGEPIEFWIWDRYPMKKFMKLVNIGEENYDEIIDLVEDLVLDESGNRILNNENLLPTRVMSKVVGRVVETLGK
jgi:hypothetical protein